MSTKTSFKRIALVAVAALGFGTLSVVPSSAAVPQADTVTVTPATTTPYYVGGTYKATVNVAFGALATGDTLTTTMSMTTTATASTAYPVLTVETPTVATTVNSTAAVSGSPATVMLTTESGTVTSGTIVRAQAGYTVTFSPDKLGTYQIQFKNSGGTNNTSATWVVEVVAKPTITVETFAKRDVDTRVTKNYSNSAWPTWQAATGKVLGTGLWQTWSESDRNAAEEIVAVTGRGTDDLTFACSATVITNATQPNSTGLGSCMNVKITQKNGMITANTGMMVDADAVALTVSVTGPANASVNGYGAAGDFIFGETVTAAKAFNGNIIPGVLYTETVLQNKDLGINKYVYVYSNGTPGVATVTIKAGTLVLETFTVNFYHTPKTVTPTVVNEVIQVSASADLVTTSATYQANNSFSVAGTGAITGKVVDEAGVPVPGQVMRSVSDTLTTITNSYAACTGLGVGGLTDATGTFTCNLVGAKEGLAKVVLTSNASATATDGASSVASSFRVGGLPTQAKISFGDANGVAKTDFVPGEQGTFNVQLLDAKGLSVPNGTYTNFFSSEVSTTPRDLLSTYAFAAQAVPASTTQTAFLAGSVSPSTGLTAALAAKIDGSGAIQRWMVNMPVNASDVELSVGGFIKGVALAKAVATVAPDKTVQAAADLAAEALDAATAAIDAANIAAENADAATAAAMEATDAVAALAVTTQAQIASMRLQNIALRKQIIALTNLIIKIQKKVKA
jgi:hypothetical protein